MEKSKMAQIALSIAENIGNSFELLAITRVPVTIDNQRFTYTKNENVYGIVSESFDFIPFPVAK